MRSFPNTTPFRRAAILSVLPFSLGPSLVLAHPGHATLVPASGALHHWTDTAIMIGFVCVVAVVAVTAAERYRRK